MSVLSIVVEKVHIVGSDVDSVMESELGAKDEP